MSDLDEGWHEATEELVLLIQHIRDDCPTQRIGCLYMVRIDPGQQTADLGGNPGRATKG